MLNRVILIGRATREPELRYSPAGKPVTKFTVACNRTGGDVADFIPVVCFDKLAENAANYIAKGMLIAVEGRWQTGSYENNEGKKIYTNDCLAFNIRFLERSNTERHETENIQTDVFQDDGKPIDIDPSDLPF